MLLGGGRTARLLVAIPDQHRVTLELEADEQDDVGPAARSERERSERSRAGGRRTPLRLALEWDRRSEERLVGLGARHGSQLDQSGRAVQLGADRRYTGPDCPPELLSEGGIAQGDCAPVPWLLSSRGYAVLVRTEANGTRFDLSGQRIAVSTRAARAGCASSCCATAPPPPACATSAG